MSDKDSAMRHIMYLGIILAVYTITIDANIRNFFEPYNVLVVPYRPPQCRFQVQVGGEFGFNTRGFMGDDETGKTIKSGAVNPLQIYQCAQDALAALKGLDPLSPAGQLAQQFFLDDDNGSQGLFIPEGTINAEANILFAGRLRLPYQLTLGFYIPYRCISLTNVRWRDASNPTVCGPAENFPLLKTVGEIAGISLHGWRRHGPGDLMTRVEMYRVFPQHRPWLQMVGLTLRAGVLFPTGLDGDGTRLFAQPFGNDGGVGMHASGMLQLCYRHGIVLGVDAELLHLFGNTRPRRIKTDPSQTDLLLVTAIPVFREPGFTQRFTLYAEKVQRCGGLAGTIAYQYFKRCDDSLFPCAEGFDNLVMNDAASLQETTAHSLIFMLSYDWAYRTDWCTVPSCSVFVKAGFNGKHATAADTAGFTLAVAF